MSEKIEFKFENNSLTNFAQHQVIQKIASHFKIPQKMVRASLDEDALKENIISLPQLADTFPAKVYTIAYKIKLKELLLPKQFEKGKLAPLLALAPEDVLRVIVSGTDIFALVHINNLSERGVGGIYMNYELLGEPFLLVPFKTLLDTVYPLPLDE